MYKYRNSMQFSFLLFTFFFTTTNVLGMQKQLQKKDYFAYKPAMSFTKKDALCRPGPSFYAVYSSRADVLNAEKRFQAAITYRHKKWLSQFNRDGIKATRLHFFKGIIKLSLLLITFTAISYKIYKNQECQLS